MTPTEQDKELGAIRQKLYVYLSEAFPDKHFDEEQFEQWLDTRKEFVDTAMQLITADRKRVALEARLNEAQNAYEYWINGRNFISSYFRDRIAELSSSKESK